MFFHRQKWQQPVKEWGPRNRVQSSLFSNLENIYGIDHKFAALLLPCWGPGAQQNYAGTTPVSFFNGPTYKNGTLQCRAATSQYGEIDSALGITGYPVTTIVTGQTSSTAAPQTMSCFTYNLSSQRIYSLAVSGATKRAYLYHYNSAGTDLTIVSDSGTIELGKDFTIASSLKNDSKILYIDGVNHASSEIDTIWDPLVNEFSINRRGGAIDSYYGDVDYSQVIVLKTILSAGQHSLFSEDTNALWQRVAPISYFMPITGAGGFLLNADIAWKIRTVKESDTAWRVLNQTSTDSSWKLLSQSTIDSSWKVLTELSENAAWKILNSEDADTSWRILKADTADTSWKVKAQTDQASSWQIISSENAGTSWKVLKADTADTSWKIKAQTDQASSWQILTKLEQDTAWKILTSGSLMEDVSWKILTSKDAVTGWRIKTAESTETAWKIATRAEQSAGWKILTTADQDTSWKILTGSYLEQDISWKILRVDDQDLEWNIKAQAEQDTAWKVYTTTDQDVAWSILTDDIPTALYEFVKTARTFIFNKTARTFIFFK